MSQWPSMAAILSNLLLDFSACKNILLYFQPLRGPLLYLRGADSEVWERFKVNPIERVCRPEAEFRSRVLDRVVYL